MKKTNWFYFRRKIKKNQNKLFFRFIPFQGSRRCNYNFVPAFRADISLAAGTGKTVAARTAQLLFIPAFPTVGAGYDVVLLNHLQLYFLFPETNFHQIYQSENNNLSKNNSRSGWDISEIGNQ